MKGKYMISILQKIYKLIHTNKDIFLFLDVFNKMICSFKQNFLFLKSSTKPFVHGNFK
tara:strand:+ start:121 stop:294 length:174 start_codon:yes stop_codon:yes gene_type:complete